LTGRQLLDRVEALQPPVRKRVDLRTETPFRATSRPASAEHTHSFDFGKYTERCLGAITYNSNRRFDP
jgi:hypothetical protein